MATYKGKYTGAVYRPKTINLISVSYQVDAIGQRVPIEATTPMQGMVASVGATELTRAAQQGYQASWEAVVWAHEYHEQKIAEIDGKRYLIYRYYIRSDGRVELYLGDKAGV